MLTSAEYLLSLANVKWTFSGKSVLFRVKWIFAGKTLGCQVYLKGLINHFAMSSLQPDLTKFPMSSLFCFLSFLFCFCFSK